MEEHGLLVAKVERDPCLHSGDGVRVDPDIVAVGCLDRALALEDAVVWSYRGSVLGELGRYDEAVANCDCVLAFDPADETARQCRDFMCGQVAANQQQ